MTKSILKLSTAYETCPSSWINFMTQELDTYFNAPTDANGYTNNFIDEQLKKYNACFHEDEHGNYSLIFDSEEDQIIFTIKFT